MPLTRLFMRGSCRSCSAGGKGPHLHASQRGPYTQPQRFMRLHGRMAATILHFKSLLTLYYC